MKEQRNKGQGLVEYTLILVLVALGTMLTARITGIRVSDVICSVAGVFKANACSKTICSDNFSNFNSSQGLTGGWQASGTGACINGAGSLYNSCSMASSTPTDYTASLNGASLTSGNGYGLFFRATDNGHGMNGYAFQYDPGANAFVIRKWVNGSEIFNPNVSYVSASGYNWYGAPHNLSIKVVSNTFIGYVDGKQVITGTDSTFTSGGSGIRTWDSTNLCLNNLSLNPIQ